MIRRRRGGNKAGGGIGELSQNVYIMAHGISATTCGRNFMTLDSVNLAIGCSHFLSSPNSATTCRRIGLVLQDHFLAQLVREDKEPCGCAHLINPSSTFFVSSQAVSARIWCRKLSDFLSDAVVHYTFRMNSRCIQKRNPEFVFVQY